MQTSIQTLSENNKENLKKYFPMRGGLLPAILWLAIASIIFEGVRSVVGLLIPAPRLLIIPALMAVIMGIETQHRLGYRLPWIWLRDYYHRNIIGYYLGLWLSDEGKLQCGVTHYIRPSRKNRVVICLKLGGWFKKSLIYIDGLKSFAGRWWKVKIHKKTDWLENGQRIWLNDSEGSRNLLAVSTALEILEEFESNDQSIRKYGRVGYFSDIFPIVYDERKNLQRKLADTERRFDASLGVIDTAITKMKQTQRFIRSEPAKNIKLWLINQLRLLVLTDDVRVAKYPKEELEKAAQAAGCSK